MIINSVLPSSCVLTDWNIAVNQQNGEEHFLGYENSSSRDRLSTPINEFNETTCIGETLSGSKYQVLGPPSKPSHSALYLFYINLNRGNLLVGDDFRWKYAFDDETNKGDTA